MDSLNMILNPPLPPRTGKFLTSRESVSFSERTMTLGVSKCRHQEEMFCSEDNDFLYDVRVRILKFHAAMLSPLAVGLNGTVSDYWQ
jgi:hypothetical protein